MCPGPGDGKLIHMPGQLHHLSLTSRAGRQIPVPEGHEGRDRPVPTGTLHQMGKGPDITVARYTHRIATEAITGIKVTTSHTIHSTMPWNNNAMEFQRRSFTETAKKGSRQSTHMLMVLTTHLPFNARIYRRHVAPRHIVPCSIAITKTSTT